jgi:hypothetical protein
MGLKKGTPASARRGAKSTGSPGAVWPLASHSLRFRSRCDWIATGEHGLGRAHQCLGSASGLQPPTEESQRSVKSVRSRSADSTSHFAIAVDGGLATNATHQSDQRGSSAHRSEFAQRAFRWRAE